MTTPVMGSSPRTSPAVRWGRILALVMGGVAVLFTVGLVLAEAAWDRRNAPQPTPETAFVNGCIGCELAPLVAFEVLPELFPDEFHPIDRYLGQPVRTAGDWIDQYGFVRKSLAPPDLDDGTALPVGFVISHHRPGSGAPSPVPFVGLSCAACHSAEIRTDAATPGKLFYGVGNPGMNLLAFSEAIRGVLVKRTDPNDPKSAYVLTPAAVADAWAAKGRLLTATERVMVRLWIAAARRETAAYEPVIDDPLRPEQLFDPGWIPAGPGRTQPFRSLVRVHLNRPGMSSRAAQPDQGFSKIPVIYYQDHSAHGEWAQFDGSVSSLVARSTLAASTAGANVNNLSLPDLAANVISAAEYTRFARPPSWEVVFGDKPDAAKAEAGRRVYQANCYGCHGGPGGPSGWRWDDPPTGPSQFGAVTPWREIGTDPNRVQFRHIREIPQAVTDEFITNFPKDHPLGTFKMDQLRAAPADKAGYYNGPIAGAFLRAPYLHNASVLTLAELIGLQPRRSKFYRGRNMYDKKLVGYRSPDAGGEHPVPPDRDHYFVFDTSYRGNSNAGHYYPAWAFPADGKGPPPERLNDLWDLLEYLKSL